MFYIMKNHKTDLERNQYLLFDTDEKTRSVINVKVNLAKFISKSYGLKGISPLNAWKYFDFKSISLGMFLPLPFQIRRNNDVIKIA